MSQGFKVFLSKEQVIDYITVVYEDGNYTAMDNNPFYPQGFCQHGEGLNYNGDLSHLGVEGVYTSLNIDCRKVIRQDLLIEQKV